MSHGASMAVVGVVLSTAALTMIILLYGRPAVIGVYDEAETGTGGTSGAESGAAGHSCTPNNQGVSTSDAAGKYASTSQQCACACAEETPPPSPHIYVMTYENYSRPYGYMDDSDELKGVMMELVGEACRRAGQQCVHMYLGKTSPLCWDGKTKRGIGLHRNYFDACVTWSITKERSMVFEFSIPLMAMSFWHIYTNDPDNNVDMIFEKKFGFVTSWVSSPNCIEEHFKEKIPPENIVEAVDLDDLRGKLKRKEVSFVILGTEEPEFIKLPGNLRCGRTGGLSIMTRYDSHIKDWFNPAFHEMRADGTYDRICKAAEKLHGAAADCF